MPDSDASMLLERLALRYGIDFTAGTQPTRRQFSSLDGLKLSYLDWGGGGPPIVFLHGGALTAHTWDLVCLGLHSQYRCIALDVRGHGDSEWADDYQIETAVTDIDALADHAELPSFHIVGMSLGGTLAAHYAATFPSRTSSLTLVDVGPGVDFPASQAMRDYVADVDDIGSLDEAIEAALLANSKGDREKIAYRLMHSMCRMPDGRFRWKQDRRKPHNYPHILGKIEEIAAMANTVGCPVLVVRGGRSKMFSDESAAACAALFVRGEWVRIPDAGHNVQEDNPAALIAALRNFITRC